MTLILVLAAAWIVVAAAAAVVIGRGIRIGDERLGVAENAPAAERRAA